MSNGESGGPYLAAALICEKVLQEKDGVLSAIRIVDRYIVTISGPSAPQQMPSVLVNLTAVVIIRSGDAKGSHTVKVQAVSPSGFRAQELPFPIFLEGDERGANLITNLSFQAIEEGLYWFDVFLDDELVTRMPLRVVYQRVAIGQSGGATPVH